MEMQQLSGCTGNKCKTYYRPGLAFLKTLYSEKLILAIPKAFCRTYKLIRFSLKIEYDARSNLLCMTLHFKNHRGN